MLKKPILFLIRVYQKTFSPETGVFARERRRVCVFYPRCSEYTVEAIKKYGILKGGAKSFKRILRCHPWQKKHIDLP